MLDLDWLLKPFDTATFFAEIWQTAPTVIASGRPGHFSALFDKAAVERVLEYGQPRPPAVRLASAALDAAEVPFSPNGRINLDRLRKLYRQGYSVVLNSVEDFDPAVAQLARAIETEMGARVQVNCYLTPAAAQGFAPHYDTHDVLVAQIEGEKSWKIYGGESVCPLNEMVDGGPGVRDFAQPPIDIRLRCGDLLYIPRGWVHEATTGRSASLHLTFGLHPPLAKDLLQAALEALVGRQPALRETLPVGPLGTAARRACLEARFAELVRLFAAQASAAEAAASIDDQLLRRGRSGGDGRLFADIEQLDGLGPDTVLERRANLPCRVVPVDDGVGLQFLNSLIKGPAIFASAMDFVAACDRPFTPAALPGLPAGHQLALAATLVTDGLCRLGGGEAKVGRKRLAPVAEQPTALSDETVARPSPAAAGLALG